MPQIIEEWMGLCHLWVRFLGYATNVVKDIQLPHYRIIRQGEARQIIRGLYLAAVKLATVRADVAGQHNNDDNAYQFLYWHKKGRTLNDILYVRYV
jgi:hypothetical protein